MTPETELKDLRTRGTELVLWLFGFGLLSIVAPISLIVLLMPDKIGSGFAVLGSLPLIEYLAVAAGIGLGIDFLMAFTLTVLPCTGIAMLMIGVLGFLRDSSPRAIRILEKAQKKIENYPRFKRYGIASNFIFIILLGMYIGPGVAIILGWNRIQSVLFMFAGICFITFLIGLGALGIVELFFVD